MGTADASPEEQLRQLQQQLQQQQQLLMQLQQQHAAQSQATASRHDGTFLAGNTTSSHAARRSSSSQGKCITNDRSAARRANRARQKALESELESRLQSIAALHSQLLAENGMLQRRATLLQAGVNMREQHLNTLIQSRQKARQQQQDQGQAQQQQQQQQRHHQGQAGPAATCIPASDAVRMEPDSQGGQCERVGETSATLGLPGHVSSSQAATPGAPLIGGGSGPGAPASPSPLQESGGQEGAQQQQQQHGQQQQQQQQQQPQLVEGAAQGADLCCASFAFFPDPGSWGTATCAMVRRMTPKDFQRCWTDFVKEPSMLALASQSHPQDSDLQQRLTKVVSTCLAVTDHITAINPSSYYSSMYVNLITGQPMNPDRDYWRDCMRRVPLQPEQLEFCKTAMEEHARKMATVLNERCKLASDLSTKLSLHPMEASDLSRKLQSNIHQEHVTNSFVADFLTIQVLTPAQIALLSAAAYPLMPDPMAMAEVAIELAESQAAQTLAP